MGFTVGMNLSKEGGSLFVKIVIAVREPPSEDCDRSSLITATEDADGTTGKTSSSMTSLGLWPLGY